MGIFLDATQNAGPRFFTLPEFNPENNLNTEEGTQRLSVLAGLARQRNNDDINIETLADISKERISQGDEQGVRQDIDEIASVEQAKRIRELQLQVVRGQIPGATGDELQSLLNTEAGLTNRDRPSNTLALEKEGVSHAQELGVTHPEQEGFFKNPGKINILEGAKNHGVKLQIFADRLDKLQKEAGDESFFDTVVSNTTMQRVVDMFWKLPRPKGSDLIELPGTRVQNLSNELWGSQTPEEFATKLDTMIATLRDESQGGATSPTAVLRLLNEMYAPNADTQFGINAVAALDTGLSSLPLLTALKVAKNPVQVLNALGNRSGGVELAAEALARDAAGKQAHSAIDPVTAVAEAMPTYAGPLKSEKIGASLSGEINRKLAKTQKIIDDIDIIRQRRLEPAQEQEALKQAVDDAEKLYGKDKILDFDQTYDDRTGLWSSHIFLGDEYGLPFSSKEAVLASAESRGLIGDAAEAKGQRVVTDDGLPPDGWNNKINPLTGQPWPKGLPPTERMEKVVEAFPGLRQRPFDPDEVLVEPVQNAGTGWTLKITRPVREDGQLSPAINVHEWTGGQATGMYRNPAHFLPMMIHGDRVAAGIRNSRLINKVIKPLAKKIEGAGKEGLQILDKIYHDNKVNAQWYTEAEFDAEFIRHSGGRQATGAEKEAYYTGILLNDVEHGMREAWMHEAKSARGMLSVSIDSPNYKMPTRNGREVVDAPGKWNTDVIYDVEGNTRTVPGNNTKRYKERWETGNYRLIVVEGAGKTADGQSAKFFFVPKQSSKIGPLNTRQLDYSPGGHRQYANKFYGKQAVIEHLDSGTDIRHNDITHVIGNETQVKKWAEKRERARQAWNQIKDKDNPDVIRYKNKQNEMGGGKVFDEEFEPTYRQIIDDNYPGGYVKFKEAVEAGRINPETPFEVVSEGGTTVHQAREGHIDWRDVDLTPQEQVAIEHRQMYYSEKGEHLRDPEGNLAETLDSFYTMSQAMTNVTYLKAYAAYQEKVVKEWARSAEKYLIGTKRNAWEAFNSGVLDPKKANTEEVRQLYRGLEAARDNMRRQMSFSTAGEMKLNGTRAKIATWVSDKGPKFSKGGKKVGDQVATWLLKTDANNPANYLHRAAFVQAFFADPGQLYVQSQTSIAAVTVHPVHGLKSWFMTPYTMLAYFNKAPGLVDFIAKGAKAAGLIDDVADYKLMTKVLRDSGWLNVGKEMVQQGMMTHGLVRSGAGVAGREIERYGTVSLRLAEGFNRLTGFQIAWRETRRLFPNVDPTSSEFYRYLTQKADDMTWNMTQASRRWWQDGAFGAGTKFQQYNANMIENMLPKQVFGVKSWGNPRFTAAMRARLIFGQYFLYGTAGIPGGYLLSEAIKTHYSAMTGKDLDRDTERKLTQGFLDNMLFEATGADIDSSARIGVGEAMKQLFQSVSGGTFDKSALELVTGPPGRAGLSMLETVSTLMQYFRYEQVENLGKEDFFLGLSTIGSFFSSFSRAEAAYYAWKTGFLLDKKTLRPIVETDNEWEILATAMGIYPYEVRQMYDAVLTDKEKSAMAYKMAQRLVKTRQQALMAYDDDDIRQQNAIQQGVATWMMPFRDDPFMTDEIARLTLELEGDFGTKFEEAAQRLHTKWGIPLPITEGHE